jgi:hypothetical protein
VWPITSARRNAGEDGSSSGGNEPVAFLHPHTSMDLVREILDRMR